MPVRNSSASTVGAPGSYTLDGPPERISAAGLRATISSTDVSLGTISEYTCASRTRRAISWAYWAPKSTTRTVGGCTCTSLVGRVCAGYAAALRREADRRSAAHRQADPLELLQVAVAGLRHRPPKGPEQVHRAVRAARRPEEHGLEVP